MQVTGDFDLERFVRAQNEGGTYARALAELSRGRKVGHWMWFVFPQLAGLGRSGTARFYAIRSLAEAEAYLTHPLLGHRLRECCAVLAGLPDTNAEKVFGGIDAVKLRSSMTLFGRAAPEERVFVEVLDRYFAGAADPATERLLAS
jgi:uncharacterized protein (DUF1810 family)